MRGLSKKLWIYYRISKNNSTLGCQQISGQSPVSYGAGQSIRLSVYQIEKVRSQIIRFKKSGVLSI